MERRTEPGSTNGGEMLKNIPHYDAPCLVRTITNRFASRGLLNRVNLDMMHEKLVASNRRDAR